MYAEVDPIHNRVNNVFRDALNDIAYTRGKIGVDFDSPEIYIVAHSEGTVVSWKSLMLARSDVVTPQWLEEIRGFVTLGSPIDKHHLFWGEQNFPRDIKAPQENKIPWWNFWDYSDPVGHSLDSIFPKPDAARNHQFERIYDAGFARYPIPGVAHVDYWKDANIYHRIIQEVMQIPAGYRPSQMETGNRWWGHWWLMRTGDFASYVLGRAAEIVAIVYFLSRLLTPMRDKLLTNLPAIKSTFDLARTWPLPSGSFSGAHWVNLTIWAVGPAAIWKFVWDVALPGVQDRELNLFAQLRVERFVTAIWGVFLLLVALNIEIPQACPADCPELKDYIGWGIGVLATAIVWSIHTSVSKGLLQVWRYGKGGTEFKP
jgi:hypothetical protein